MVCLDVHVTPGVDRQVEAGVAAKRCQHVVVEGHARADVRDAGAVEVELDDDVGFLGRAFDAGATGHRGGHGAPTGLSSDSARLALVSSSTSFSSARPVVARRKPGMPTSLMSTPASR